MSSTKSTLRLAENTDDRGDITTSGADRLVSTVSEFAGIAKTSGCEEMMAFATSAVRDANNSEAVLARVRAETGVNLEVLSGVDEARLTFLAVRRWYGWSAGRILNLDIGGGSLELTAGGDEDPDADPPGKRRVAVLRDWLDAELVGPAKELRAAGDWDRTVGTSKTFRSLARLTGAAPSAAGPRAKRTLTSSGLRQLIAFISRMTAADRAELEGVSSDRSQQIVAGALIAEATMRALGVDELEICPWALREGLILRKLDTEMGGELVISVAELLKRNGQSVESRGGRRRRGVAGGISVAELTGEIPIVRQSGSRAAAESESGEPAAQPEAAAPETA
eukprot:gene26509-31876_t